MTKLRVLHIHSGMSGGGIETFITTMASALEPVCDTHLFSLRAGRVYEGPDLPMQDEQQGGVGVAAIAMRLWRHVRTWKPSIIHTHFPDATRYGAVVRSLTAREARLVVHCHNVHWGRSRTWLGAWLGRFAVHQADAILACSRAAAEFMAGYHSMGLDCVRVLYNPVDLSAFDTASPNHAFRAGVGAGQDDLLAIFLGRMAIRHKGLDVLCAAAALLPPSLRVRVALVGPGDLEALAEQLDVAGRIVLSGPVRREQVAGTLRACDIFVHPSRWEGLGISIIEAMAAELPVIATRVGGIPEIVEDGVGGILVEPEDPQALADAIQWMVEHPAERAEMGRRGRERAQLFDVHTIASQLEAIYHKVLHD